MKIAVLNGEPWQMDFLKNISDTELITAQNTEMLFAQKANAFIIFNITQEYLNIKEDNLPVLLGCVCKSNKEMNVAANVIRFNDWNGFLEKTKWEISGETTPGILNLFHHLGKEPIFCSDVPGFISARIIALIINEAYIALAEGVSTKGEIDIAMRLGTNYPYGPFEWCEKIGRKNIYFLLSNLSNSDERYLPAPMLVKECNL